MKVLLFILLFVCTPVIVFCQKTTEKELFKKEVLNTEKAFEKMVADSGIAEAFYFFADTEAVIKRGNDSLIFGKDGIKNYYSKTPYKNAILNWTPDFIEVSVDGTLASTYGKFVWKWKKENGEVIEFKGIFHTVWKKQKDNTWKYIWD